MQEAGVNGAQIPVGLLRVNALAKVALQNQRRRQSKSFDAEILPNEGVGAFAE